MAVDDHGLEVLKKSGAEITPGNKSDYYVQTRLVKDDIIRTTEGNTLQLDAFSRKRVSNPYDILDHKNITNIKPNHFDQIESGGTLTWDRNASCINYAFTADGTSKRVLRQTEYLPYTSGKSHMVMMTGIIDEGNAGSKIRLVKRSNVTGTVQEIEIEQENWSADTLLGNNEASNPSGHQADFTKTNIFFIDLQWLGVGRVRTAVTVPETSLLTEAHRFLHAGTEDNPYIRTPTLPIRYELVTDGTTVKARIGYFDDENGFFFECYKPEVSGTVYKLKEICFTCSSEAAIRPNGLSFHANTRGNGANVGTTGGNILALRLANTNNGYDNRSLAFLSQGEFFAASQNTIFEVYKVFDYTDNSSTWTRAGDDSAVEFAAGSNLNVTVSSSAMINCSIVTAGTQGSQSTSGSSGVSDPFVILDQNRNIKQNFDSTKSQMFLVKAYAMASTTDVGCSLTWFETE